MFQYRIQPGDNIYRIANYFDISVAALLAANAGLLPNQIFPGQVILIPISGNLYQNYPWYYLLPYLFIQQPRHYWDDRRRWPRDWRDWDRRDHRGDRDRWDRDHRGDRDRWDNRDHRGGRDRRDGRGRNYMGNWNDMLLAEVLDDFEDEEWRDMYDERNDIDMQPGMQPGMQPEMQPGMQPGMQPRMQPEMQPRMQPEMQPRMQPEMQPRMQPEMQPRMQPEMQPRMRPEMQPRMQPGYPEQEPSSDAMSWPGLRL